MTLPNDCGMPSPCDHATFLATCTVHTLNHLRLSNELHLRKPYPALFHVGPSRQRTPACTRRDRRRNLTVTVASTCSISQQQHETLGPVVPLLGPSICRSSRPFSHVHLHPRRVGSRTPRVSAERNIFAVHPLKSPSGSKRRRVAHRNFGLRVCAGLRCDGDHSVPQLAGQRTVKPYRDSSEQMRHAVPTTSPMPPHSTLKSVPSVTV